MNFNFIKLFISVASVVVTLLLSYQISKFIIEKKIISKIINSFKKSVHDQILQNLASRYNNGISIRRRKSLKEKIEYNYIIKPNINRSFKHIVINIYTLLALMIFIFYLSFKPIYDLTNYYPTTFIICTVFALSPLVVLDVMAKYNSEKIRHRLAEFITILSRWCSVKDDIFYAFEKSIESGLEEPLRTYIEELVIQIKAGIDPMQALDILRAKVDNEQFSDFIYNIKMNIKSRSNTKKLLSNLERQFYRIENEYIRRKISTFNDRIVIYIIMVLVLVIGIYTLRINVETRTFYLDNFIGKNLLALFALLYAAGIFFTLKITKFKY